MQISPHFARACRYSAFALAVVAAGLLWTASVRPSRPTAEAILAIADSEASATAVIPALGAFVNPERRLSLMLEPIPSTRLVRVRASAPAADQALDAVATVTAAYIERQQTAVSGTLTGELDDVRRAQTTVEKHIEQVQAELASLRADVVIRTTSADVAARGALARARRTQLEARYHELADASAPDTHDLRVARSRQALDIAQEYEVSKGREQAAEEQESAAREDAARVATRVARTSELFAELARLRGQSAALQQRERTLVAALQTVDSGARLAGAPVIVTPTRPVQLLAWLTLALAVAALLPALLSRSSAPVPSAYSRFRLPGRRRRIAAAVRRAA